MNRFALAVLVAVVLASPALAQPKKDADKAKVDKQPPDKKQTEEDERLERERQAKATASFCAGSMFCMIGSIGGALLLMLCFDMIPVGIAMSRGHPDTMAIALVSFLLGWSFIGWIIALVCKSAIPGSNPGGAFQDSQCFASILATSKCAKKTKSLTARESVGNQ